MRNALITGATSGIGAAYSRHLAKEGYNLWLTGRRKDLIKNLSETLEKEYGVLTTVILADFTSSEDMEKLIKKIDGVSFDMLINNVGFGHKERFFEDSYYIQRSMIDVHIDALSRITHKVVGGMKNQKKGTVINVSSLAAFTPSSFNHLYTATKAYIVTFSEALHMELSPLGINVQAFCPGFTKSDFHRGLDIKKETLQNRGLVRWMKADDVASLSLKSAKKNGGIYVPGWHNKILYLILKLIPRKFYYKIAKKMEM